MESKSCLRRGDVLGNPHGFIPWRTLEGFVHPPPQPYQPCVSVLILTWNSFSIILHLRAFETIGIMAKPEGLKCAAAVSKAVTIVAVIR